LTACLWHKEVQDTESGRRHGGKEDKAYVEIEGRHNGPGNGLAEGAAVADNAERDQQRADGERGDAVGRSRMPQARPVATTLAGAGAGGQSRPDR
jgi:hypothetical protein